MRKLQLKKILVYVLLIAAMVGWGLSWVMGKYVADANLFWTNGYRFGISAFFLLGLAWLRGEAKFLWSDRMSLLRSVLLMIAYNIIYLLGLRYGKAGSGGMISPSMIPLFVWLFVHLGSSFSGNHLPISRQAFFGLVMGFIAVIFFATDPIFISGGAVWALLTINSRTSKTPPLPFSGYLFAGTGLVFLIVAPFTGPPVVPENSLQYFSGVAYLSLISSGLVNWIYFYSIRIVGSRTTSQYSFLVPGFAIFFSWLLLGEIPELNTLIGGAFAFTAALLLILRKGN